MRLVVLSDTHGQHGKIVDVPEGDILIHAGDFMNSGTDLLEIISFYRWLGDLRDDVNGMDVLRALAGYGQSLPRRIDR